MPEAPVKRQCRYCEEPMHKAQGKTQYCGPNCRKRQQRRLEKLSARGVPEGPVLHLGPFQDYQRLYCEKIDVILTDLPYGRSALPIYQDLADFALGVRVPGGHLLCMTGYGLIPDILRIWCETPLEYITFITYCMQGGTAQGVKYTSTGKRVWNQMSKPVLWFQKRGTAVHHRRAGTSSLVGAEVRGSAQDMDREAFHWQQSLDGFGQLVWKFTNPQDVIMDPCMGSGWPDENSPNSSNIAILK